MKKRYDASGMRLTDCCGAHSTYDNDSGKLYCKACYGDVSVGEGDGSEYKELSDKERRQILILQVEAECGRKWSSWEEYEEAQKAFEARLKELEEGYGKELVSKLVSQGVRAEPQGVKA